MPTKKLTITSDNISPKQWSVLLIELNMIRESWRPFAKFEIHTSGLEKTIKLGKKRHDEAKDD